ICPLINSVDGGGGVDLGKLNAASLESLNLADRTRDQNHVAVKAVFRHQPQILRRPNRRLEAGEAGIGDKVKLLRGDACRQDQEKDSQHPSPKHFWSLRFFSTIRWETHHVSFSRTKGRVSNPPLHRTTSDPIFDRAKTMSSP